MARDDVKLESGHELFEPTPSVKCWACLDTGRLKSGPRMPRAHPGGIRFEAKPCYCDAGQALAREGRP